MAPHGPFDAIDLPNDAWVSYLNPNTGEIVTVTDEDRRLAEEEDVDEERLPEWERESLHMARAVLESGDCLALPNKFEIHEVGDHGAVLERSDKRGSARRTTGRDSRSGRLSEFR
jgi:hypothetical protein